MTKEPIKLKDISREQLDDLMLKHFPDLMNNNSKIAATVLQKIYDEKKNFGVANAMNMAKNAIIAQASMESAKSYSGLVVGANDTYGSKAKAQFALHLPDNGKMIIMNSWDKTTKDMLGGKATMTYPATGKFRVVWEESKEGWKKYELVAIEKIVAKDPNPTELLELLAKLGIKSIQDLVDVKIPDKQNIGVCFKGKIRAVYALNVKGSKEEMYPVIMDNSDPSTGRSPVFKIAMEEENGVDANVFLQPRKACPGLYLIEDLPALCEEALLQSDDPRQQATYLGGVLEGKTVVVIGALWSRYDQSKYVDYSHSVGAFAIIEVPEDLGIEVTQATEETGPQQTVEGAVEHKEKVTKKTKAAEEAIEKEMEEAPVKEAPTVTPEEIQAEAVKDVVTEEVKVEETPKKTRKPRAKKVPKVEETPAEQTDEKETEVEPAATQTLEDVEKEIFEKINLMAGMFGHKTIGEFDISGAEKGAMFRMYKWPMVLAVYEKNKGKNVVKPVI